MSWLDALILGLVEGITEFLPISSTGHLILTSSLLGLPTTEFLKSFEIAIQLGAIGAVLFLYWRSFLDVSILTKLLVGFIPTAVMGFALYSFVKTYLLGNPSLVVWTLLLGGIALIVFELFHKEQMHRADSEASLADITLWQSFCVGLFQSIAIIPGVSRSAATILGGMLVGIRRTTIVQFSFLLAVPTMAAATGLDMFKSASLFSFSQAGVLAIGFVAAFIVALLSMRFLLRFVRTRTFVPFGVYRIVVALLFFFFIIL